MLANELIAKVLMISVIFYFSRRNENKREKITLLQYFDLAVAYQLNPPYYVYQIYIFYSANCGIELKLNQYRLFFIWHLCKCALFFLLLNTYDTF